MQVHSAADVPANIASGPLGADMALRRGVLLAARDPSAVQDRIDCAELARALGLADAARALYDVMFVRAGFAPSQRLRQAEIIECTGLWPDLSAPRVDTGEAAPRGFSVDVAISELTELVAGLGPAPIAPYWPDVVAALVDEIVSPTVAMPVVESRPPLPPEEVFATCALLRELLEQGADRATTAELAILLDRLREDFAQAPLFDLRTHLGDPEALIAALVSLDLQHFLRANLNLAFAPFGSAELLHAAARLEPAALGPYFSNMPRLIRDSRDVPAMVQLALGGAAGSDMFNRWTLLLSTHLDMGTLLDLVDELGDRGMMRPLWLFLYTVVRDLPHHRDRGPLWRIRDAGLDNRDMALGACAQRAIAAWAADDAVEWSVLGEIQITAGDRRAARRAFLQGLHVNRRATHLWERLRLLRLGQVRQLTIRGGFGTPKSRQRRRLARHPLEPEAVEEAVQRG